MSNSNNTVEQTRAEAAKPYRDAISMVRRMTIRVTSGAFWQVVGGLLIDQLTTEQHQAESFSGIGFYARPKSGANTDALVGFAGGAENPIIVATRDEATRKRVAKIGPDETAAFNTQSILHITKAGKILAYLAGHVADAVGLAKVSELNNLRAFVMQQFAPAGHTHAVAGASTTVVTAIVTPVTAPATDYDGTEVLKGQ